jgi:hypothetical protein
MSVPYWNWNSTPQGSADFNSLQYLQWIVMGTMMPKELTVGFDVVYSILDIYVYVCVCVCVCVI